jgi:hypothetical protein
MAQMMISLIWWLKICPSYVLYDLATMAMTTVLSNRVLRSYSVKLTFVVKVYPASCEERTW